MATSPVIGLTPNEYLHFKNKYPHYRLFVVTGCLSKKQGHEIFGMEEVGR